MNGRSNLLSGVLGGLVVAVVVAILLATGAVDTGKTTTIQQRQAPLAASSGSDSSAASETGGALTVGGIYKKVAPGVAFIQATITETTPSPLGFPQQQRGQATGSGFVLNQQGYIATNAHVVAGAKDAQVSFGKGAPTPAKIVGTDPSTDLAVIKVDPSKVKLTTVPLGDSDKLQVGDPVVAIGNPFGLDDTVTTGVVSALGREIKAPNEFSIDHTIQTDAAINPGNSGGPLLDDQGRVVGINAQIATGGSGKGSVGIGFAIPINLAKSVFPLLIKTGKVPHAYVGITTAPNSPALAKALNLPVTTGALVQAVQPGSPAEKAGLRAGKTQAAGGVLGGGDLIVAVDGKAITAPADIATAIADNKPGDAVTISYYRGRAKRTVTLTLANRPAKAPSASLTPGGP
jgi:S1-C subfamily serine protease